MKAKGTGGNTGKFFALLLWAAVFPLLLGAGCPEKLRVITEEDPSPKEYKFHNVSLYTDEVAIGFADYQVYLYDPEGNFLRGYQFPASSAVWGIIFHPDGTFDRYSTRSDWVCTYDRDGNFLREREYQSEDWMESTNNVNSLLVEYRYKRGAVWKEFPDGRQELFRKVRGGNDGTGILFIFFGFAFLKLLEMYLNRKKQPPRETAAARPGGYPAAAEWVREKRRDDEAVQRLLWGVFLVVVLIGCVAVNNMLKKGNREEPPPEGPAAALVATEEYDGSAALFVSADPQGETLAVGFESGKIHLYNSEGEFLQGYQTPGCSSRDGFLFLRGGLLGHYDSHRETYRVFSRKGTLFAEIPVKGNARKDRLSDGTMDTDARGNRYRVSGRSLIRTSAQGEEAVLRYFPPNPPEEETGEEERTVGLFDIGSPVVLAAAGLLTLYLVYWNSGFARRRRARRLWERLPRGTTEKGPQNGE